MSRNLGFLVFFFVALLILGSLHYYLWARLVRDAHLSPAWQRGLGIAAALLCLSIPFTLATARRLPASSMRAVAMPGYVWLGCFFLLLVLVLGADMIRAVAALAARVSTEPAAADPERRRALYRLLAGTVAVLGGTLTLASLRSGLSRVRVKRVEAPLARLPAELDGLKIVQLTDIHVGPTIGRDFIEQIVSTTNALNPDVVAITGDLVDGSVQRLGSFVEPLGSLDSRFGTYFVTGNHEYNSGAGAWCAFLKTLGIRVLRNERVSIERDGASLDLAGVDDYSAGRRGGQGPDLKKALDGRDAGRELVLLAHQPRAVAEASTMGVGLQLSGHTHGGQIWPWNWLVRLQQPVVSGLAKVGDTLLYVSNGTGYWGPPMRLGAPAEITEITLRATS